MLHIQVCRDFACLLFNEIIRIKHFLVTGFQRKLEPEKIRKADVFLPEEYIYGTNWRIN